MDFKVSDNAEANKQRTGLACAKSGRPYMNHDNALRVLNADFKNHIWYDNFHMDVYTDLFGEIKAWDRTEDIMLAALMQRRYGLVDISASKVSEAVTAFAYTNVKNEPKDWFNSLKWDGEQRLSMLFHLYFGAPLNEYTATVSQNFMVAMVARVFNAGCKFDNLIVLEGPQGYFKSSALEIIGGKWYTSQQTSASKQSDFNMCQRGHLLIELPEMAPFESVTENTKKDILSRSVDHYRAPYDIRPKSWPRQSIFVGTTNDSEYLNDATGNRRYWPITITNIDLDRLKEDREQLFAEAVQLYKQGYKYFSINEDLASREQSKRLIVEDVWCDIINDYIRLKPSVTIKEIAINALEFDRSRVGRKEEMRIGKILRSLDWAKKIEYDSDLKKTVRLWRPETEIEPLKKKTINHQLPNYAPAP
jgi:putative DNA primase/helicase